MTVVVTDAIVLHAFDYLESSRIVRLATRESGVLSVLARGARRSRNNFGSALDLFAEGVAHIHTRTGRELQTLAGFDTVRARGALALDLERFSAASAIAELTLRFFQDAAHVAVFDVLRGALDAIAAASPDEARETGIAAAWQLVAELGFAPSLDVCASCHAELDVDSAAPFSHAGGGVVCPRCARSVPLDRALPSDARRTIRLWLGGVCPQGTGEPELRAHQRLLREFLMHHLADDRELRAFASWEQGALRSA